MENNGFDEWYQIYPRHEAKAAAQKAYAKAVRLVSPEVLIEACKRYALKRMGQDMQYTKLPATWLNQGCWADGLSQTVARPEGNQPVSIPGKVEIKLGTPAFAAWDAYWKKTRGVHAPFSQRSNSWWFPTEFPPEQVTA